MSSFKKLNKADITTVPYAANKQWSFTYTSSLPNDDYMVYYVGKKEPFNTSGTTTTNGLYQSSIFDSINHLFYQAYSGSKLDTGSLMFNVDTYQSASQDRPTGSYFNYNINPNQIKNFPTSSSSQIGVLSINQNIFGSKLLPHSFNLSCPGLYNIIDDGVGNVIDTFTNDYVGNAFYAQGIVVFTNQNYINLFPTTTPPAQYDINIYGSWGGDVDPPDDAYVAYRIDGGNIQFLAENKINSESCDLIGSIKVYENSEVDFFLVDIPDESFGFEWKFDADYTTICLPNAENYCGDANPFPSGMVTGNVDIAITAYVAGKQLQKC